MRIGFIASNIYQGISIALWKSLSALARETPDCSLFILPGGQLDSPDRNESMRSCIYSLIGNESLDAAIVWTSSLSGYARDEDMDMFVHRIAGKIPVVSIGERIDGIPSVLFDSYGGMRALVSHFIEVHGERRIAFIRGPERHKGAEERFRAYKDALSSHGIALDSTLVSSPCDWNSGADAMKELTVSRSLVPGKDFTSVVSASDLLMASAALYLETQGVRIPEDLRIGGFNDTDDNRRLSVGLTTVHLPIERIAEEAFRRILSLLEGGEAEDAVVSTALAIRHSCGCSHKTVPAPGSSNALEAAGAIRSGDDIHGSLRAFISASGDLEAFFDALSASPDAMALYRRIAMEYRRSEAESRMRVRGVSRVLDGFKTGLLAAKSYGMIPPLMKEYFPKAGIMSAYLVLFSGDSSVMRAGFSKETLYSSPYQFPRDHILPGEILSEACGTVFVIEPLFLSSLELGYIVLAMESTENYLAESLRSSFSSAVKGITLFEEVEKARLKAEKEEYEALLFYSNISKGVLQPLSEIRGMLLSDTIDREKLSLKLSEADHILRLALIERTGFSLEERLIPFDAIASDLKAEGFSLDVPGELPSFQIDRNLFVQMMKLMLPWSSSISGRLSDEGLILSLSIGIEVEGSPSLIMAERIAFISSYGFSFMNGNLSITIRYPRLSGEDALPLEGRKGILFLSSSGRKAPSSIARCLSSDNPRAVAWIHGDARDSEVMRYKGLPMACFSLDAESRSLDDILIPDDRIIVLGGRALPQPLSAMDAIRIRRREDALGQKGIKLIVVQDDASDADWFRSEAAFSSIPILLISGRFSARDADMLSSQPLILFANPSYLEAPEAEEKLRQIMNGAAMLPPFTAASVRKAIAYINENAGSVVSRWQIAERAGVNEDYLTRIFRREMGMSPWEYLNRYRVQLAASLLSSSSLSMRDIAAASGFQDPAYFCRIFKKVKGMPPGAYRKL